MRRTRIKFCGMTRLDDALAAAELGVDAIGLVFVERSKRCVGIEQAATIARALPPFVQRVGLFMDAAPEAVRAVLAQVPLDLVQFHGSEPPEYCRSFHRPYLKALAMGDAIDAAGECARYADSCGILLDAHRAGEAGGTGLGFDWTRIPSRLPLPLVLAGGLNPDNVAQAIRACRPYAVDVASGVEASPGRKDVHRMQRFIEEVSSC